VCFVSASLILLQSVILAFILIFSEFLHNNDEVFNVCDLVAREYIKYIYFLNIGCFCLYNII